MTKTEQVYGGSLYELAAEEGFSGEILQELEGVLALFDEIPDYWRLLSTRSIPKEERCAALEQAFGGRVQPYLLNFMKILCENGTIGQLRGCAREYRRRYNQDNGIVEVRAVTAVPLRSELREKLQKKLETVLGKTILLSDRVDPACVGGIRLELEGKQLDGTVQHRLDELGRLLQSTAV